MVEIKFQLIPKLFLWDKILIQLAKILDNARWTIDSYSYSRVSLCEEIVYTMQYFLYYAHMGINIILTLWIILKISLITLLN